MVTYNLEFEAKKTKHLVIHSTNNNNNNNCTMLMQKDTSAPPRLTPDLWLNTSI